MLVWLENDVEADNREENVFYGVQRELQISKSSGGALFCTAEKSQEVT
jgi:hypothetical protein